MKAIQISFDERLLARLDGDEEVKRDGRSAVLRRAVAQYLERKRRRAIADAYRRGYGKHPAEAEFGAWAEEAAWPEE
jgi:metal-responsive CopG/Arc/MetJ family transcriptional regulator